MKNFIKYFVAAFTLVFNANVFAATWNYINAGNDEIAFFFDSDTVEKAPNNNILVWIKTVQKTKSDSDGSWSKALKWKLNCKKRTQQTLLWSTYNSDGKFISSSTNQYTEEEVVPDSMGDIILKFACEPNFPNDLSGKSYFKLKVGSNPIEVTKWLVDYNNSHVDKAPQ
jgi:hypothetical protein